MQIRRYLLAIRRLWWLLLLVPLIIGGSAYAFSVNQPSQYASTVRVIVGQTLQSANPDYASLIASERLVNTYAELAQGRQIFEATANQLGLGDARDVQQVVVQPVADTEFMDIMVTAANPELAAQFANELANQLILKSPTGPQSAEAKIRAEMDSQIETLKVQIDNANKEIDRLKAELDAIGPTSPRRDKLMAQLQLNQQLLSEDQQTLSTLYNTVLQSRSNTLTILEPAEAMPTPVAPQPIRTGILAGVLGCFLALGLVLLLEYLDDSIKSPEAAVEVIQAPLLAAILKQAKPATEGDRLVLQIDPRSPAAESFRTLRTNLQFSNIDTTIRTLLITSSQPSEGKSTVASNLALALSQTGQRVILIDADLRKPMLHKIFQLSNLFGLTSLLSSNDDPETSKHALRKISPSLTVVTSGPHPPNPSELLSSKRMEMLLWLFQQEYDWVICDSPPVLTVTDALALVSRTDGVMLVSSLQGARRDILAKTRSALETVGAKIIGLVVNKVDERAEGYYAYYSYYQDQQPEQAKKRRWFSRNDKAQLMSVKLEQTQSSYEQSTDDVDEAVAAVHEHN